MRAGADIERMHTVFENRERRARKQLIEDRKCLNDVLEGLHGAEDIERALRARLHRPIANRVCVADLVEAQDHARVVAQQMQEVARLKGLAYARSEQMRGELVRRRQQWQKAQYRVTNAQALREARRLQSVVRLCENEEEDAGDQWVTQHRTPRAVTNEYP